MIGRRGLVTGEVMHSDDKDNEPQDAICSDHSTPSYAYRAIMGLTKVNRMHNKRLVVKPSTPPDLKHCADCGKVIGPHKGWFGC